MTKEAAGRPIPSVTNCFEEGSRVIPLCLSGVVTVKVKSHVSMSSVEKPLHVAIHLAGLRALLKRGDFSRTRRLRQ